MDQVLDGFDSLRRGFWRQATRTRLGRACASNRNARLTFLAVSHAAVALTLATLFPLWLMLLGPLVLGVPHVLADIRFFVARPARPIGRFAAVAILTPLGLIIGCRVAELLGILERPHWTDIGFGCAAITLAAVTSGRSWPRRIAVTVAALGLSFWALQEVRATSLFFAHAHNVVAVAIFALWARSRSQSRAALTLVASFALGVVLLGSGALEGTALRAGAYDATPAGLSIDTMAASLAPGLPGVWALRLVVVYAFAQAMHYALWLRLTPGAVLPGPVAPSFRRSARGWVRDLGPWVLGAGVMMTLLVPILAATGDPIVVRDQYLALAGFHGWLELAMLVHFGLARPASTG